MVAEFRNFSSMKIELDESVILKNRPRSVSITSRAEAIKHSLDYKHVYTWLIKGWDMSTEGEQVYFICEVERWIPSDIFEPIEMINPN